MADEEIQFHRPNCRKSQTYVPDNRGKWFPFCSERCKLIDLGKWFEGEHRIEEPVDLPPGMTRQQDEQSE